MGKRKKAKPDGFGHERGYEGKSNDWITPTWVIDAFGHGYFDLDPCASLTQPWSCARKAYTIEQDGLLHDWVGNIWLNPPYGPHTTIWVKRLVAHGTGIALIFARLETGLWQDDIFPTADGFLFVRKRIQFYRPDGTLPRDSNGKRSSGSGAPSALIAWGAVNRDKLLELSETGLIRGAYFGRAKCKGVKV